MVRTEDRNEKSKHIDKMTTYQMLKIIQDENYNAVKSLEPAMDSITKACDIIAQNFEKGGRLFYMGAGTSGRLGVIDAAECPPTYGVPRDMVVGIIAGGNECMCRAAEGQEDDGDKGVSDLAAYNINSNDTVVGISAAGNAEYVVKAIEFAKSKGCKTIGITNNHGCKLEAAVDVAIVALTGAEVVTGSTRMKAGTAQKLILNMLSTVSMIKTGKVYENLMINLRPTNKKLTNRMIYIVTEILGVDFESAERLLKENEWNIRKAIDSAK